MTSWASPNMGISCNKPLYQLARSRWYQTLLETPRLIGSTTSSTFKLFFKSGSNGAPILLLIHLILVLALAWRSQLRQFLRHDKPGHRFWPGHHSVCVWMRVCAEKTSRQPKAWERQAIDTWHLLKSARIALWLFVFVRSFLRSVNLKFRFPWLALRNAKGFLWPSFEIFLVSEMGWTDPEGARESCPTATWGW